MYKHHYIYTQAENKYQLANVQFNTTQHYIIKELVQNYHWDLQTIHLCE